MSQIIFGKDFEPYIAKNQNIKDNIYELQQLYN